MIAQWIQRRMGRTEKWRSDDCQLSGAYQRTMLYGGAALLTFAIFVAIAITINARVDRFIDDQRYLFSDQRATAQAGVQLAESRLREIVMQHEARRVWGGNAPVTAAQVSTYANRLGLNSGVTIAGPDLVASKYTLAAANVDFFRTHAPYVISLLNTVSPTPVIRANADGIEKGNFVYDGTEQIFAFHPAFEADAALENKSPSMVQVLAQQEVAEVRKEIARHAGGVVWTIPHTSTFSGERVVQYATAIEQGQKRLAVVGYSIRLTDFRALFMQNRPPLDGFYLLSQNGADVLMGAPSDNLLAVSATTKLFDMPPAGAPEITIDRSGGAVVMAQRIRGPEWIAVYALDWPAIVVGLREELGVIALTAGTVLALLWTFVRVFDKTVLIPMQRKIRRVYESEAFNRTVVDTAPIGLCVLDTHTGDIVMKNVIAGEILERASNGADTFYREVLKLCGSRRHRTKWSQGEIQRDEIVVGVHEGKTITVGATFVETRYDERDVVLCGITDVTQAREMQTLLTNAKRDAEMANDAKSMFLAAMSHEIRTPLHAALGNLELLSLQPLTPGQNALVETIGKSFGTLRRLLNDILDFSKIEAGELRLEPAPFDPLELAETCSLAIYPSLASRAIGLRLIADEAKVPWVKTDSMRLQQIIMNLLDNASKFTLRGEITLAMTVRREGDGRAHLEIKVSDTGIGISPEDLGRLFKPFTQAGKATAHRFGGTGLGLTLCRRLAELMGGSIDATSTEGVGSTFEVLIPVTVIPRAVEPIQTNTAARANTYVLDCSDEIWRTSITSQLNNWGLNVVESATALEIENAVLVIARAGGVDSEELMRIRSAVPYSSPRVVLISETYPSAPECRDNVIRVTSLSRPALRHALTMECDDASQKPVHHNTEIALVPAHRARILIVEDDEIARTLISAQLGILGFHHVDCVANATDAIHHCHQHKYRLILSDLNLPDMSGTELLSQLRRGGVITPVILVSASAPFVSASDQTVDGFCAIVEKPLSLKQLQALLIKQGLTDEAAPAAADLDIQPPALAPGLWKTFARNWPEDCAVVTRSFDAGNLQAAARRLHKIKGALQMLDAPTLAQLTDQAEKAAKREDADTAASLWETASSRIKAHLKRLDNVDTSLTAC